MSVRSTSTARLVRFSDTTEVFSIASRSQALSHTSHSVASSFGTAPPPPPRPRTIPLPPPSPAFVTNSPQPLNTPPMGHVIPPATLHRLFNSPAFIFDLSVNPAKNVMLAMYSQLREWATSPPLPKRTIICSSLPWTIVISTTLLGKNKFLAVEDIIYGLYQDLRKPFSYAEYEDIQRMDPKRSLSADEAFTRRWQRLPEDNPARSEAKRMKEVKRVDYLGPRRRLGSLSPEGEPNVFRLRTLKP